MHVRNHHTAVLPPRPQCFPASFKHNSSIARSMRRARGSPKNVKRRQAESAFVTPRDGKTSPVRQRRSSSGLTFPQVSNQQTYAGKLKSKAAGGRPIQEQVLPFHRPLSPLHSVGFVSGTDVGLLLLCCCCCQWCRGSKQRRFFVCSRSKPSGFAPPLRRETRVVCYMHTPPLPPRC